MPPTPSRQYVILRPSDQIRPADLSAALQLARDAFPLAGPERTRCLAEDILAGRLLIGHQRAPEPCDQAPVFDLASHAAALPRN